MRVDEEDPHRRPQLNWDLNQKKKIELLKGVVLSVVELIEE